MSVSCQLYICWDPLQREAQSEWLRAAWRVGVYDGLSWLLTDVEEPLWAAPLHGLCPELCKSEPAERKQGAAWDTHVSQLMTVDMTWLAGWVPAQTSPQQQTTTWNSKLKWAFPPKLPMVDVLYHSNQNEDRRHGMSLPGSMTLAKTRGNMCYLRKGGW